MTTRASLTAYVKLLDADCPRPTNEPNSNPRVVNSGNGSLMRLSPVPAALHRNPAIAIAAASLQSRVTHASPLCVDSCVLATAYMIGFYHAQGESSKERKEAVLHSDFTPFADGSQIPLVSSELKAIHGHHAYKNKEASDISTAGFVLSTLEAALWALWHGNSFEEVGAISIFAGSRRLIIFRFPRD